MFAVGLPWLAITIVTLGSMTAERVRFGMDCILTTLITPTLATPLTTLTISTILTVLVDQRFIKAKAENGECGEFNPSRGLGYPHKLDQAYKLHLSECGVYTIDLPDILLCSTRFHKKVTNSFCPRVA